MFGNEGYTLAEVSELFDCDEEIIVTALSHDERFVCKKYGFFGPIIYRKEIIDGMAPQVRADMKRLGRTRADVEASKQEIKQHEESIAETQRQMLAQREAFNRRIEEMVRRKFERDNQ